MLVLTRRKSEALMMNDEIIVRVLDVNEDQGQVRIGIAAPQTVEVHREEVYNRINELAQSPIIPVITHKRRFRAVTPD